jgi:hypothetical protein
MAIVVAKTVVHLMYCARQQRTMVVVTSFFSLSFSFFFSVSYRLKYESRYYPNLSEENFVEDSHKLLTLIRIPRYE